MRLRQVALRLVALHASPGGSETHRLRGIASFFENPHAIGPKIPPLPFEGRYETFGRHPQSGQIFPCYKLPNPWPL